MMVYEVTISSDGGIVDSTHTTLADAIAAVVSAAKRDGLTVQMIAGHCVDEDRQPKSWFSVLPINPNGGRL
jgi:hypothetical protein